MTINQLLIVATFLSILVAGFIIRRRTASLEEYALARSQMRWFRIAAGISMTFAGGAAVLNMASIGYTFGWYALVDPAAVTIGCTIAALFVAKYRDDKGVTMAQMLSTGYKPLALLTGIITSFVYLLILSAQIVALSKLLAPVFPSVPVALMIVVPTSLVFLYTIKGGFVSVTVTDVLQLWFMILFLLLPIALFLIAPQLILPDANSVPVAHQTMPVDYIILFGLSLLFIPLSQDTNLRAKSALNRKHAVIGLLAGAAFYSAIVFSSSFTGISLSATDVAVDDPEHVFTIFFSTRGSLLALLPILAALAAIVSSLDAYALNTITSVSSDIVDNLMPKPDKKHVHRILLTAGIVFLLAMAIALYFNQILSLVLFALLVYISVLGPIALGNRLRMNGRVIFRAACLIAVGLVTCQVFEVKVGPEAVVYPACGVAVMLIAKLLTKSREHAEP